MVIIVMSIDMDVSMSVGNGGPDFLRVQVRCFYVTNTIITQKVQQ